MKDKVIKVLKIALPILLFLAIVITAITMFYVDESTKHYEYEMCVGEKGAINLGIHPYTFENLNENVISFNKGEIVAKEKGNATVKIKYSELDRAKVSVRVKDAPKELTLNNGEDFLVAVNQIKDIETIVDTDYMKSKVTYKIDDPSIAAISAAGSVKGLKVGTTKLTATTFNGVKAEVNIVVKEELEEINLSTYELSLGVNDKYQISCTVSNSLKDKAVKYLSSNKEVAIVDDDGNITAKKEGTTEITAIGYNNIKSDPCKLSVLPIAKEIKIGSIKKAIVGSVVNYRIYKPENTAFGSYKVYSSNESVLQPLDERQTQFYANSVGVADIVVELPNGVTSKRTINVIEDEGSGCAPCDAINQFETLPTGCETVALTQVLQYMGIDVDEETLADDYLPIYDGESSFASLNEYYFGDPYSYGGMGCNAPVIASMARRYIHDNGLDSKYYVMDVTGAEKEELYSYITNDMPVVVWATSGFNMPYNETVWEVNGEENIFYTNEHCLTLRAYKNEDDTVAVADDMGGQVYVLSAERFFDVYEAMGSQAVVIGKYE